MSEHLCVVCRQLRPGADPRIYDRARVCDGCRARLRAMLGEIPEYYAAITLVKGKAGGDRVSGSRTPPLPLAVDALDATMPPQPHAVQSDLVPLFDTITVVVDVYLPARPTDAPEYPRVSVERSQRVPRRDIRGVRVYGPSGDQVGYPSAPAVLDAWARDWQTYRWAWLPDPNVPALAKWLTERLDWACDEHPAVEDFAAELDDLAHRLRPRNARPELKVNVPCRECETAALYRWPGSDYVECGACPALLTPDEYERWTQLIASREHRPWVREVLTRHRGGEGNAERT